MTETIKDAAKNHWVYRMPKSWIPYLQLSRLDRPIGYWLLTLPGWIALSFAGLSHGLAWSDLKWALLILIGAIAMRGAGCTYNDIVDRDLDAKVDRTALRPIPAGTVSLKQAWIWLLAQCLIGLVVLLFLPRLAQIMALCSIPLVAAYPFMKRITWWPQVWLGLTFNWAALVAYAAKTDAISPGVLYLYAGLIFWTIGYDTIYACQDIEDDAFIGIKSTARRFDRHVKLGIFISYLLAFGFISYACFQTVYIGADGFSGIQKSSYGFLGVAFCLPFWVHLFSQVLRFSRDDNSNALALFKSNCNAGLLLTCSLLLPFMIMGFLDGFPN